MPKLLQFPGVLPSTFWEIAASFAHQLLPFGVIAMKVTKKVKLSQGEDKTEIETPPQTPCFTSRKQ